LGYAVAAPSAPLSLEEVRSFLPPAAREHFCDDADALREMLQHAITREHSEIEPPPDRCENSSALAAPARPERIHIDPSLLAAPPRRPERIDTGIILLAAMVILALATGAFCLWKA
jgi:hypothetical protein